MDMYLLAIDIVFVIFAVASVGYMLYDFKVNKLDFKIQMKVGGTAKTVKAAIVMALCLFIDGLGIGSYGPMTAGFKALHIVRDKYIPGTLQTVSLVYTLVASLVFIQTVEIEIATLASSIIAAGVGAFLGGGLVSRLDLNKTRIAIGACLILVAFILIARLTGLLGVQNIDPECEYGLTSVPWKLAVLVIVSFVFGALMTIGVGIYAPLMCTVALLGMNVTVAYPLMLGSCAVLIPVAAISFIKNSIHAEKPQYDRKVSVVAAIAGTIGGAIGVAVITFAMETLDISMFNYVVAAIIVIIAIQMIYQGVKKKADALADEEDDEFDRLKAEYLAAHPEERPSA